MKSGIAEAIIGASMLILIAVGAVNGAITLDNTMWVEYAGNPVYDPSTRAYYPCVVYDAGTYKMWYASSGSGPISYATSLDGIGWTFVADCTGLKSPNHCWVIKTGSSAYEMWYWDATQLYSIAAIRHADSTDGVIWTNDAVITQDPSQPIVTGIWPDWNRGSYGPCNVLFDSAITTLDQTDIMNNRYVMYYDGTTGGDESIGVAGSLDGKYWVGNPTGLPVLDHPPSGSGTEYVSRCTVLKEAGVYRMWFSYGISTMDLGIGYAESTDGILWEEDTNNPIFHVSDGIGWRTGRTYTPSVLKDGWTYKMWFTGLASGNYAVGYATLDAQPPQHYLTVEVDPSGLTTIPGEGWYNTGTTVTLTAPPVPGATFLYWDVDGVSQGNYLVNPIMVLMDADHTATAHYSVSSVGGEWAPINVVQLAAPYVALAFVAIAALTAGSWRLIRKRW